MRGPRRAAPRCAALLLALAVAALAPTQAAATSPPPRPTAPAQAVAAQHRPAPRTTLPAVESQVMCVTCKISLSVAQSPQANRERVYIQHLIGEGRTLAQVKSALVYQYGSAVLALPPSRGFDLGAYIVPAVVVLALLIAAAVLLPRWRRRARAAQAARDAEEVPAAAALSSADAARLQADMARFD